MKSETDLNPAMSPKRFCNDVPATAPTAKRDLWLRVGVLWERILRFSRRAPRQLRLCESLPLGERRFVAVVEFERARFLVGGTSASLVLLARLGNGDEGTGENESASPPKSPTEISAEAQS
jgi:flagellar biogenesis protein FliO